MHDHFEQLISKSGEGLSLTPEERSRTRALLAEYAAMKPVHERASKRFALPGTLHRFLRPAFAGVATLLMLLLTTGGITYAAEGSLPGDLLYGVKVAITEPVVSAFTASGEAQARWQMTLAERRVHEAAALARVGRLSEEAEAALATQFKAAADNAAIAVAEESDSVSATVAVTGFATRLAAYDTVLEQSVGGTPSINTLRTAVNAQIDSWKDEKNIRAASTSSPTSRTSASVNNLEKLERKTATALQDSAHTIGQAASTLNASTTKSAKQALEKASKFAEEGRARLKEHDDEGAAQSFRAAIGESARLDVLTRAAASLNINAFENEEQASSTEPDALRD